VVNDLNADAARKVAGSCGATVAPRDAASVAGAAALVNIAPGVLGQFDMYCAHARGAAGDGDGGHVDCAARCQVNVKAHVRAAGLGVPAWLERGGGHLVCGVSAAGLLTMLGTAPYSATKHAALSFAEWLAATYAHRGLTVQALCPMGVRTAMLDGITPAAELILGETAITAEEVADAVVAGIADGGFLILPHPDAARMYAAPAAHTCR